MILRKIWALGVVVAAAIAFSGCRAPLGIPPLVVALTQPPPSTVEVKLTIPISANVIGGPSPTENPGVTWSVACGSANCGTFSAAATASGASTTYTAPATPPSGGTVTITATATGSTGNVNTTATVTITPVATAASLSGQYAFYLSGYDNHGLFYVAAGSVTLDGMGNVTAGEEDFNDASGLRPSVDDAVSGTYTVGPDGRGSMILNATASGVPDVGVGVGGTQTLSFTVVNNNHALIEEFDSAFTSTGSLDLQSTTAASALAGTYSFYFAGSVVSGSEHLAVVEGGVMVGDVDVKFPAPSPTITPPSNTSRWSRAE